MLANVEALPTKEAVDDFVNIIRDKFSNLEQIDINEKHKLAKSYLALERFQMRGKCYYYN